jgi:hypothetical protein
LGGRAKEAEPPEAAEPDELAVLPLVPDAVLEPLLELQAAIASAATPSAAMVTGVERDADLSGFLIALLVGTRAGLAGTLRIYEVK